MKKDSSLYDARGHVTPRGERLTVDLRVVLRRRFRKALSPREARDLERLLDSEVALAACFRILEFQKRKVKSRAK